MTDTDSRGATGGAWYEQEIAARSAVGSDRWRDDIWDDPALLTISETSPPVRRGRLLRWVLVGVAALAVVAAIIGGSIGLWVLRQVNPSGDRGDATTFIVRESDDLVTVSHRLRSQGFITHAGVFQWYVKRGRAIDFTPGYYTLRPRDTMGNIASALRTPPNATFSSVTFPEGYTVAQIGRRLQQKIPRLSASKFVAATKDGEIVSPYLPSGVHSLEGLLFPDTYQVSNAESERQVVVRMVRLLERVGRQEGLDDPLLRGNLSPYEVLVIASLIEREARFDEDRPKIARVILNRLALGMPLEIDASLYYGHDTKTPFSELKSLDTAYNTYLHLGLPPTPIANPGRASIRAALNPAVDPSPGDPICRSLPNPTDCRYLYYVVSDRLGHHTFAATLEQHQANVARAREAGLLS